MPKTYKNIFEGIYDFSNLYDAYLKARKEKRYREGVLFYTSNLENNLVRLMNEIKEGVYRPGKYHTFSVYEPKKRKISSLPFKDRIVQHALNNVIEPIFEKVFIYDSYACRKYKGTHSGVRRLTHFLRSLSAGAYCFKGDIANYFPSVSHNILRREIARRISDKRALALIDTIIFSHCAVGKTDCGLPVGNLTSQLFANVYMNQLDYFVKHNLHCRHYIRYVDDFIVLDEDKKKLAAVKDEIEFFLRDDLRLALNKKSSIFPVKQGVDFLGYRIWRTHRLLRKSSVKKMKKKIAEFAAGGIIPEKMEATVASWLAHSRHADTYNLTKKLASLMGKHSQFLSKIMLNRINPGAAS
ncbi:MAG: RNA-dependent DNA polymerase [Elusimicrobia bacterium HGW-Elusimicrobia-1]|nr:MAG: RNA-dependent DNA polymerase [Elusimicrobia bacterium HGW-Elusimicrobia-1]